MTMQRPELVTFQGIDFELCKIDGAPWFEPRDYGFVPYLGITSCHKGWFGSFEVTDRLLLQDLSIYLEGRPVNQSWNPKCPPINGTQAECGKGCDCNYRNLRLPLRFTGGVLLGKDSDFYGKKPFWNYKTVFELSFSSGLLEKASDKSAIVQTMREKFMVDDILTFEVKHSEEFLAWLEESFDFSFITIL